MRLSYLQEFGFECRDLTFRGEIFWRGGGSSDKSLHFSVKTLKEMIQISEI